jgi:hypothetical protein
MDGGQRLGGRSSFLDSGGAEERRKKEENTNDIPVRNK